MSNKNNSNLQVNTIMQNYGTRKGMLYTWLYRIFYWLSLYQKYEKIDWSSVERLVFVCKGNICRSAYADILARSHGALSVSCGLDTTEGVPANQTAVLVAKRLGNDLQAHRTTSVKSLKFSKSDLLIAMEPHQAAELVNISKGLCQYTLLGLWGSTKYPHLQDPYGSAEVYFESCFKRINEAVNAIIEKTSA